MENITKIFRNYTKKFKETNFLEKVQPEFVVGGVTQIYIFQYSNR